MDILLGMGANRQHLNERLAGIGLKLDRAEKQLEYAGDRAAAWIAEEETWEISAKINEGERRYVVSLRLVKPPPPCVSLVAGEVVHHARSSLDHLAAYLVEWSGGHVGRAAWPITRTSFDWAREVERRKRPFQFWRKKGGGPLAGAGEAVRAFVQRHQPYERGGEARDDPLLGLNDLWNAEKHRVLNPVLVYAVPTASWDSLFHPIPEIEPVLFKWIIKANDVMELGTDRTLALLEFPLDHPLPGVKMDGHIPCEIAIGDGKGTRNLIEDSVALVRSIVREAENLFPPPAS